MKYPIVIFIMGPPGSGKDTQAELLSKNFNLIRISTSNLIEKKIYSIRNQKDKIIEKQRRIYESGALNTPSWILELVKEHVYFLMKNKFNGKNGIIFSGSPRTPYESENLLPFLENIFSKENMLALYLNLSEQEGLERVRERSKDNPRALDDGEKKLKLRIAEFNNKTIPAIKYLEDRGYLIKIDGSRAIEKIGEEINKIIKNKLK